MTLRVRTPFERLCGAEAVHDAWRIMHGKPALADTQPSTAGCVECGRPLTREGAVWLDDGGGTVCPASGRPCMRLDYAHLQVGAASSCPDCHGVGMLFGEHRPAFDNGVVS